MRAADRIERHRGAIRGLLLALGIPQGILGLWALLAPRSFYGDFPAGRGWVAALGAYDEHLVRDVGSLFVALAVVMTVAAARLTRTLVLTALAAWLAFSVPHLAFHLLNLGPYGTGDGVLNAVTLAWTVGGALVALALAWRPSSGGA